MNKLFILVVLILVSGLLFAQELPVEKGSKAIRFGFDGLDLSEPNLGIGAKYWYQKDLAFVGEFDFAWSKKEDEDLDIRRTEGVEFYFGVEKHKMWKNKISPYYGGGISANYEKITDEKELIKMIEVDGEEVEEAYTDEIEMINYGYDFCGVFGIEYFITSNISLAGQYSLSVGYDKKKTSNSDETRDAVSEMWGAKTSVSKLMLSIYF